MKTTTSSESSWGERKTGFVMENDLAQEKDPRTTSEGRQALSPASSPLEG